MTSETKNLIKWLIIALVVITGFLAIMFAGNSAGGDIPKISDNDWTEGNPAATLELIEYSDFECPACAGKAVWVRKIVDEFLNHIRFAYRHFPLKTIHDKAVLAARAAEAAGIQGKFWEMHDMLFERQSQWSEQSISSFESILDRYAVELGLNADKFNEDLDSGAVKKAVEEDSDSAMKAGLNSTPTFILNGEIIKPRTENEFREIIRAAVES